MSIIGSDLHACYQQIAMLEVKTGETMTRRLEYEKGEAKVFYTELPKPSLIGIEATGTRSGSSACWRSGGTSCGVRG